MTRPRKVVIAALATNEGLRGLIDKALGFPKRGVQVGIGPHVNMPLTWDGNGPTPPGWSKTAVDLHTGPLNSALELPDQIMAMVNGPEAQSRLSGPERAQIAQASASRVTIDLPGQGYAPPSANASVALNQGLKND